MKLAYFVSEDWFFCSHFIERAAAARQAGYDVIVLTNVAHHADAIISRGLRLIPVPLDRRSANPFKELMTIWRVWKIYRAEKPDLVHHVALKPVLYGSIAARLVGGRKIVNAPVGMGYVFISPSLKARLLRAIVSLGLRFLLNPKNSKVVFENDDDRRALIAAGCVKAQDAILIRGAGIDTARFQPSPEPPGIPAVILTARMLWDKGVGEFVEAARLLRARGVPGRFWLVGGPDPLNRAAIPESILRGWQDEGVIEWLGQRGDIADLLGQSVIACMPSYREGLPKSLLEALACGRPIVTSDVPGCRETVIQNVNGLMVPLRDAKALADALEILLIAPEKRAAMGRESRKLAEREFAQTRIIAETLALYEGLHHA